MFVRDLPNGIRQLVHTQRSRTASPESALLRVNVGVYSCRLGKRLGDEEVPDDPESAHWIDRYGSEFDSWIRVSLLPGEEAVGQQQLLNATQAAISGAESVSSDEKLRELWLTGKSPGQTDLRRMILLAAMLQSIGPLSELRAVVEELRRQADRVGRRSLIDVQLRDAGIVVDEA